MTSAAATANVTSSGLHAVCNADARVAFGYRCTYVKVSTLMHLRPMVKVFGFQFALFVCGLKLRISYDYFCNIGMFYRHSIRVFFKRNLFDWKNTAFVLGSILETYTKTVLFRIIRFKTVFRLYKRNKSYDCRSISAIVMLIGQLY